MQAALGDPEVSVARLTETVLASAERLLEAELPDQGRGAGIPLSHPRESPDAGLWGATTRRRFLQRAGLAALALAAAPALAACSDTTVPGGQDPHLAPGGLPLARPDHPVSLPIYPDNPRIPSGLEPESGPLQLYNWAEYVNEAVLKSFEKKYGVEVQLSTFSTLDEAVAKLAAGAVGYDVFVPTQPEISLLVAGKLIQPLNLNYIPNLRKNVWKIPAEPLVRRRLALHRPLHGLLHRDRLAQRLPPRLRPVEVRQPLRQLLADGRNLGQGGDARRPARRPRLRPPPQRHHRRQHRQAGPGRQAPSRRSRN